MHNPKSIIAIATIAILGAITSPALAAAKVRVVATTTDLAEIARAVGGDRVEVTSLSKGYQNPHFIEPRPTDIVKVGKAQVFAEMGLELEIWANPLLDAAHNTRLIRVTCDKGIAILDKPTTGIGPQHGDVHPYGNPHYHLDPGNWKIMAAHIEEALEKADPGSTPTFEANLSAFGKRVDAGLERWTARMAPYRGRKVIDYHRTWTYFAHRYGLAIAGYIEAKPGIPPSPSHLEDIIDLAKSQDVRAIFQETWLDRRYPDLVARQSHAKVVVLPSSIGALPGTDSYEALFDKIVDLTTGALGR